MVPNPRYDFTGIDFGVAEICFSVLQPVNLVAPTSHFHCSMNATQGSSIPQTPMLLEFTPTLSKLTPTLPELTPKLSESTPPVSEITPTLLSITLQSSTPPFYFPRFFIVRVFELLYNLDCVFSVTIQSQIFRLLQLQLQLSLFYFILESCRITILKTLKSFSLKEALETITLKQQTNFKKSGYTNRST